MGLNFNAFSLKYRTKLSLPLKEGINYLVARKREKTEENKIHKKSFLKNNETRGRWIFFGKAPFEKTLAAQRTVASATAPTVAGSVVAAVVVTAAVSSAVLVAVVVAAAT